METTIKKLPKSEIELGIEVTAGEFNSFVEKAIFDLGKDLQVRGFRKGNAPKEIIEKEIGQGKILTKAGQLCIRENYPKAIRQLADKIEVISQPEIEILKLVPDNPFVFRAKIQVLPEIILPDYKKIAPQIRRNKVFINEQEIRDSLVFLQKYQAKFTSLQRPAQKEDFIEIEYESSQINSIKQNLSNGTNSSKKIKDRFILGKGRFVPGFEEKLIGMRVDEEKEFSLLLPKNSFTQHHFSKNGAGFKKDLTGKEVNFKVKLIAVQKMELPELNDKFACELGNFDDLVSLKKSVKEELREEKEKEERQRLHNEILAQIAQKTEFETPEVLIELEKNRLFRDLKERVNQNLKISFEDYLTSIKQSEEQFKESFLKEAQKRVKNFLILKEIGKREKITVSEEEIKEKVVKILKQYSPTEREKLDTIKLKEYAKGVVYNEKIIQKFESFIN